MNQAQYTKLAQASLPANHRRVMIGEKTLPTDVWYDSEEDKWRAVGEAFTLQHVHWGFYARLKEPTGDVPGLPNWRYLNSGETLQENDIFQSAGRWYEASCVGTVLQPPQTGSFARLTVPLFVPKVPAGYALLKRGEHVQAGDIVHCDHSWTTPRTAEDAEFINKNTGRLAPNVFYARPIAGYVAPTPQTWRSPYAPLIVGTHAAPYVFSVPAGYRLLGEHETRQVGDLFCSLRRQHTWPVKLTAGNPVGSYRSLCIIRPIERAKPDETLHRKFAEVVKRVASETPFSSPRFCPQKSYPIPDGYRMLRDDETIAEGDKFFSKDKTWCECHASIGRTSKWYADGTCVIRPVEQPKPAVVEETWPAFYSFSGPSGGTELALFQADGSGVIVRSCTDTFPVGKPYKAGYVKNKYWKRVTLDEAAAILTGK